MSSSSTAQNTSRQLSGLQRQRNERSVRTAGRLYPPPHVQLLAADAIVLATPIYYFGVSAQLKAVIDRFYSINAVIGGKKSVFIATMGNPDIRVGDSAKMMYDKMVGHFSWEDYGQLIIPGVWAAGVVESTSYGVQTYELGRSLR